MLSPTYVTLCVMIQQLPLGCGAFPRPPPPTIENESKTDISETKTAEQVVDSKVPLPDIDEWKPNVQEEGKSIDYSRISQLQHGETSHGSEGEHYGWRANINEEGKSIDSSSSSNKSGGHSMKFHPMYNADCLAEDEQDELDLSIIFEDDFWDNVYD